MGTIVTNVRGIESVVDALQAGVWTLDRDGVTTYANQRMHEMLAAEPPSLVGRPLLDFVDSVDHDKVVQGLRRRAEGRSDSYDARLRRADGTVLHVRIQASPVVEQGSFIGSVAAVTDVSDLATTTASIRALSLELERLSAACAQPSSAPPPTMPAPAPAAAPTPPSLSPPALGSGSNAARDGSGAAVCAAAGLRPRVLPFIDRLTLKAVPGAFDVVRRTPHAAPADMSADRR